MPSIDGFGTMEFAENEKQHQIDVQNFLNAYTEVLELIGGKPLVEQMHKEVKYLTRQGIPFAEALSEHYGMTKKEYGI